MVYLIIAVALLCLSIKGYCGKRTGNCMNGAGDAFLFNLVRMIFCIAIGFGVVLIENAQNSLAISGKMLAITLLSGLSNAAFLAGWLLAIQKNSMVTVDVTLTIGSLIPSVLCAICFGEPISPFKMIGFALIVLAAIVLSGYNKATMGNPGALGIIFVAIAAIGDGIAGFSQQLYRQYYTDAGILSNSLYYPKSVFHFYTYLFAALFLLLFFIIYLICHHKKAPTEARVKLRQSLCGLKKPLPYILIMAICLFAATYFQTVATNDFGMSSQVLYPVIKGGCLITVNFTAMLFFGEKMTRRSALGSLIALCGIIIMNIL